MSKHFILVDIKTALYKNLSMKNSHINVHNNLSKIKESFTVPWNLLSSVEWYNKEKSNSSIEIPFCRLLYLLGQKTRRSSFLLSLHVRDRQQMMSCDLR